MHGIVKMSHERSILCEILFPIQTGTLARNDLVHGEYTDNSNKRKMTLSFLVTQSVCMELIQTKKISQKHYNLICTTIQCISTINNTSFMVFVMLLLLPHAPKTWEIATNGKDIHGNYRKEFTTFTTLFAQDVYRFSCSDVIQVARLVLCSIDR